MTIHEYFTSIEFLADRRDSLVIKKLITGAPIPLEWLSPYKDLIMRDSTHLIFEYVEQGKMLLITEKARFILMKMIIRKESEALEKEANFYAI